MSELAKEYYEERSARLGITTPIQLKGAQFGLLHPDTVISVHGSRSTTEFATDRYEAIVKSAGGYVWEVIESGLNEDERAYASYARGLDTNSLSNMLTGKLVPNKKSLRTGRLTGIYTEAVARPELALNLLKKHAKTIRSRTSRQKTLRYTLLHRQSSNPVLENLGGAPFLQLSGIIKTDILNAPS